MMLNTNSETIASYDKPITTRPNKLLLLEFIEFRFVDTETTRMSEKIFEGIEEKIVK
jgi:hypothetical protein